MNRQTKQELRVVAIVAAVVLMAMNDIGCEMPGTMSADELAAIQTQVADLQALTDEQAAVIAAERAKAEAIVDETQRADALAVIDKAAEVHAEVVSTLHTAQTTLDSVERTPAGDVDVVGTVLPFIPPPFGTIGAMVWGALATARAGVNRSRQTKMISAIEDARHQSQDFSKSFADPGVMLALNGMGRPNRKLVDAVTDGGTVSPI